MFESPFLKKKVEFKKEDTTFRAQFLSGLKRVDDFFVDAIPSDEVKQLPVAYMYPVGLVVFIVLLGIFTGVFIPGEISVSELLKLTEISTVVSRVLFRLRGPASHQVPCSAGLQQFQVLRLGDHLQHRNVPGLSYRILGGRSSIRIRQRILRPRRHQLPNHDAGVPSRYGLDLRLAAACGQVHAEPDSGCEFAVLEQLGGGKDQLSRSALRHVRYALRSLM